MRTVAMCRETGLFLGEPTGTFSRAPLQRWQSLLEGPPSKQCSFRQACMVEWLDLSPEGKRFSLVIRETFTL